MIAITDQTTGVWRVRTTSGARYVLDLDNREFVRERGVTGVSVPLRRDQTSAILLKVVVCEVGSPMELRIDLSWSGVIWTRRLSAPVVSIEQIRPGDDTAA